MLKLSFLKFRLALLFAVLFLSLSFFSNRLALAKGPAPFAPAVAMPDLPAEFVYTTGLSGVSRDLHYKINHERRRQKLRSLVWHEGLADLAYDFSETMAKEGFFDHEDNDGNTVVDRAEQYGLGDWKKIGENLFQCYGYNDPAEVAVRGWLESPGHRRNILDSEWTHTGIGVYRTRDGEVFITQVFLKK